MGTKDDEAEEEAKDNPILVVQDSKTGTIWAHVVDRKGPIRGLTQTIVSDIEAVGYGNTKVILKSDQEVSMEALKNAIRGLRSAETIP